MVLKRKLTCQTGLKKNIIKKDVFKREIALCRKLWKKHNGKCGWGICRYCGVIPLLYKLHKGKILEKEKEIRQVKNKIFRSNET